MKHLQTRTKSAKKLFQTTCWSTRWEAQMSFMPMSYEFAYEQFATISSCGKHPFPWVLHGKSYDPQSASSCPLPPHHHSFRHHYLPANSNNYPSPYRRRWERRARSRLGQSGGCSSVVRVSGVGEMGIVGGKGEKTYVVSKNACIEEGEEEEGEGEGEGGLHGYFSWGLEDMGMEGLSGGSLLIYIFISSSPSFWTAFIGPSPHPFRYSVPSKVDGDLLYKCSLCTTASPRRR